ncbi:hypothetical protein CH330_05595, partial [candidate division WOR-3 bacterium JGI_Cruoil_03_51_56]
MDELIRLFVMNEDGSGQVCLTPGFEVADESPVWPQDEEWLVSAGENGLYKVFSDPGDSNPEATVLLDSGLVSTPTWSPDGDWIAYSKWEGNHKLYKIKPDGSEKTCLTNSDDDFLNPCWSPDSQHIVCEKTKNGVYQLYLVDAETGEETQVTSDYYDNMSAGFTPDGDWIVFAKTDYTGFTQIYKIRPNDEDETALTSDLADHLTPQVSADGLWIAYTTWPTDDVSGYYGCSKIEAVDLETGEVSSLTDADAARKNPCWSPCIEDETYSLVFEERPATDFTDAGGDN